MESHQMSQSRVCVQDAESQDSDQSRWVIHGLWAAGDFIQLHLRNKTFRSLTRVISTRAGLKEKNVIA